MTKLGKGLDDRLAAGLAERRILERRTGKRLGLLPRTTWPAADTTRDNQLRRSLTVCLVDGGRPDERTAALVALLAAVDQAHKAVTTNHAATEATAQEARQGDRRGPVGRQGGQRRGGRGARSGG